MSNCKKSVSVGIKVNLPARLLKVGESFIDALEHIDALYQIQTLGELTLLLEKRVWREMVKELESVSPTLFSKSERDELIHQLKVLSEGIFDLYPVSVGQGGVRRVELIVGKVFSGESAHSSYYSGACGKLNLDYSNTIELYDGYLDRFREALPVSERFKGDPVAGNVPEMRCMDVFSLAGALNAKHKPICIFYSGGSREGLSSLSHLTVFINLYTARFRELTWKIAEGYLLGSEILRGLSDDDVAKILLVWLRGHDVGHFMGVDKLSDGMSEFDRDYMCLHEFKSDLIALNNLKYLPNDVLSEDLIRKVYLVSIAEMFRYIRRGNIYGHPDSASAYLAYLYLQDRGAIGFHSCNGKFEVYFDTLESSVTELTGEVLRVFAQGDVERARGIVNRWGGLNGDGENGLPHNCPDELLCVVMDESIPRYIEYDFELS